MKAPSPFFKNTRMQYAWDQTSLGLLMECPRKYQYSILDQWRKIGKSVHLDFGGFYATAMERFAKYRAAGKDFETALDMVVDGALRDTWLGRAEDGTGGQPWAIEGETKKTRENLIRSIIWYFETYREDTMETVILPNGEAAVELLFTINSGIHNLAGLGEYIFTGHLDRLVDFDGNIFVMDQKTTGGALGAYYFSKFDLDNQMFQYTFAGKIGYNVPVKGVVIDAAQIMVGFTAYGRGITMRSNGQLEEWHETVADWLQLAEMFERTGRYPMNLKSCENYGGCDFKSVCSKDPAIRENYLKTEFAKREWNPLNVR